MRERLTADLAERMADASPGVGMLLGESESPEIASPQLLVGEHGKDDAAGEARGSPPSPARNAVIIIATPDFMSSAPRPDTIPSAISATKTAGVSIAGPP